MHVSIVSVVAFFAAAVAANGGFAAKTFGEKCKLLTQLGGGKENQTAITAWCLDDAGKRWQTTLNLNRCIGNNDGWLTWEDNGNFDQTCHPCILNKLPKGPADNVGLKCSCRRSSARKPVYAEILISPSPEGGIIPTPIKLLDGRFVCGPHLGDKIERRCNVECKE